MFDSLVLLFSLFVVCTSAQAGDLKRPCRHDPNARMSLVCVCVYEFTVFTSAGKYSALDFRFFVGRKTWTAGPPHSQQMNKLMQPFSCMLRRGCY
jgi:hypothetical protein